MANQTVLHIITTFLLLNVLVVFSYLWKRAGCRGQWIPLGPWPLLILSFSGFFLTLVLLAFVGLERFMLAVAIALEVPRCVVRRAIAGSTVAG